MAGKPSKRRGFTMLEILVALAIAVILGVLTLPYLFSGRSQTDLTDAAGQIAALLREAQSQSVSQTQGVPWGVHFENATATAPFFALFSSAYSTATVAAYYRLPSTVGYASSSLASGSALDITFAQISGAASAPASITLYLVAQPLQSSTIKILPSGAVSY